MNILKICPYKGLAIAILINILIWANYLCYLYLFGKVDPALVKNVINVLQYLLGGSFLAGMGGILNSIFGKKDEKVNNQ